MQIGAGAPRSPLYGAWNVAEMSIDGVTHPPLITDTDRWRRVLFNRPDIVVFQGMNDVFVLRGADFNMTDRSLALTGLEDNAPAGRLSFDRPAPDRLTLEGEMDGHRIAMRLQRFDHTTLPLLSRGFHWVQEAPFNR